jgi:hypothetical protein
MPIVFLGMGSIPATASVIQAVPIVVAATAAAGAVVGAIHGAFLAKALLPKQSLPGAQPQSAPGPS